MAVTGVTGDLLALFGVGFVSALVPVVNIEAYLGVRGSLSGVEALWLFGFAAALGQMAGKAIWYYLGANSLHWAWVARKVETPKAQARLTLWRTRIHQRPVLTGALVFLSAFSGFPPFAILAVLAGQLRMGFVLFVALGMAGRWLRFTAVLGGAAWLARLLG